MNRDHVLSLRLNDQEHERLQHLADERGQSLSGLLRDLLGPWLHDAGPVLPFPTIGSRAPMLPTSVTYPNTYNIIWNVPGFAA